MKPAHRNDIDGLRAVAILPVLFYHAAIWPFSGGYVGVDVFFVISGYLITGLILRAQDGAGFSLADFYDRRIRRILPALGAMLLAASLAAAVVLLPDELVLFGKSLAGSVLFYANILYWLRDTGYFAPDAGQNPLLHVWSLSVEEQFYLFWPLLLIGMARWRRAVPAVIVFLAAASLGLALAYATAAPNVSFYLLPARAWQLLVGAFLATGTLAPLRNAVPRHAVALGGIALVLGAALLPGAAALYHPLNALGAAFGTAAILYAAEGGANVVSAVLATRAPVFIGRISYSLYLWHWPALVFARLYLNRELRVSEALAILAVTFVVSILSWKYIEQPIRNRRGAAIGFRAAAAGGVLLLGVAALFVLTDGLPARVPPDVRAIDAEGARPLDGKWCGVADNCVSGNPAFADEAVLWGDSHARALAPGLGRLAADRRLRLRVFTRSSCPPLPDLVVAAPNGSDYPRCAALDRAVHDWLAHATSVRLVILEAQWEVYPNEHRIRGAVAMPAALDGVLDQLGARHIAVLLVGNVPRFADVPAHCYGRERMFGRDPARCLAQPLASVHAVIGDTDRLLVQAAARHPATRAFLPADVLCHGGACEAFAAGHVLYGDEHHLSRAGAKLVGDALGAALRDRPSTPPAVK